jgi:hypothetical protein
MNNLHQALQQTQYNMPTTPLEPQVPQATESQAGAFGIYPIHPAIFKLHDAQIELLSDLLESGAIKVNINPGWSAIKLHEQVISARSFMANRPLLALLEKVNQPLKSACPLANAKPGQKTYVGRDAKHCNHAGTEVYISLRPNLQPAQKPDVPPCSGCPTSRAAWSSRGNSVMDPP